ncbi:MAG: tRNA (adenosine(37)-N6)-threonylcarbamoyltransferase complex ATPase subunit type 1 TsaE [Synergistaceae bacterium]|jgi:tRNA threonylcarbamoyladenosine biosynthesis protein TsaE|nr:tRNA (adenosine(37)-N6)-threonylcarbamoyltransferase complex ATPase subunit type 1 TsaE [Synergistaceae bacterium]
MSPDGPIGRFPSLLCRSVGETEEVGRALAGALYGGLLVLLSGELGAGKTSLARALGEALGARGMKSPTFAIESIHSLPGKNFSLVHADLYRVGDTSASTAQLEEYVFEGHAVLVEWGERWKDPPSRDRWDVDIRYDAEDARSISLTGCGLPALCRLSGAYSGLPDSIIAGGVRGCR